MRRLATLLYTTAVIFLLAAPAALAHDGGEGYYGQITDKVSTIAGFSLILFFPILITCASLVQGRLEKRKDARLAAAKARSKSAEWNRGW